MLCYFLLWISFLGLTCGTGSSSTITTTVKDTQTAVGTGKLPTPLTVAGSGSSSIITTSVKDTQTAVGKATPDIPKITAGYHQGPQYTFGCLENGNVMVKGISNGTNITIVGGTCNDVIKMSTGSAETIKAACLSSLNFANDRSVTFTIKDEVFDGSSRATKNPGKVNGGQNSHMFTVKCQSLPDRGKNVYIVHGMGLINSATVKIPTEIETVAMHIKSEVYSTRDDVADLPDMSSVHIGDKFYMYLVYLGKDKYNIIPTKCTAFEGSHAAEPALSVPNVLLWTRGSCISDQAISYRLMHNFKTMSSDPRVVYAELFGFQFHSSAEITFVCEVKICKPGDGSTECTLISDQTCRDKSKWTAKRRRRQSNHDDGFKVIGKIQIESQYSDTQDNSAGMLQISWMYLIATYILLQIKWHVI